MTDWNMVIQGNISLLWIQECLKAENADKKVKDLRIEFEKKNEGIDILNPGTLSMAAYLLFVYPKEKEFKKINFSRIDVSKFNFIKKGTKYKNVSEKKYIAIRVRNSIAHGKYMIQPDLTIILEDNNKDKNNLFRASIKLGDFGHFINEFMFEVKRQLIK